MVNRRNRTDANAPAKPKDLNDEAAQAKYKEALAAFKEKDAIYRQKMAKFHPDLSSYAVLLSNYNGDMWSTKLRDELDDSLKTGKIALVIVHAANNSIPGWPE